MRIEARVEERDRGAASAELIGCVEPHRSGNDFELLLFEMGKGGSKLVAKLRVSAYTVSADWLAWFPGVHVDGQQRVERFVDGV
jgi:hypothetical protein